MPLDFPPSSSSPYTGSNGVTYVWDGQKWVVSGSGTGPYLLTTGGTMSGPIVLAADPATDPQAANKHYVDASINLAGNYLGTWAVASNTPNINAGGSISNANYVATTVVAGTPETVPVGVPGIAGMSVTNGDRVIWAAGLGVWQILRNAGVTLAAADARYYPLATNPSSYQTAANVTTTLVPYALLASPPLTGNPTAPTPTAGDNDTSIATTAFVQSAARYLNYADNGGFAVNQRGYVSGTALAAGAYAHDRWKGGAGGCTYTFTQSGGPATTITITAGTLQQVIEGASLAAGNYMLSWTGTAQGRVGAGAYAASPVTVAGVTAGANTTIEFGTGTLGQVKFEAGTVVTPWVAQSAQRELANCQRFFQASSFSYQSYQVAGLYTSIWYPFPVTMRATPTVAFSGMTYSNGSGVAALSPAPWGVAIAWIATAQGATAASSTYWSASADL